LTTLARTNIAPSQLRSLQTNLMSVRPSLSSLAPIFLFGCFLFRSRPVVALLVGGQPSLKKPKALSFQIGSGWNFTGCRIFD